MAPTNNLIQILLPTNGGDEGVFERLAQELTASRSRPLTAFKPHQQGQVVLVLCSLKMLDRAVPRDTTAVVHAAQLRVKPALSRVTLLLRQMLRWHCTQ